MLLMTMAIDRTRAAAMVQLKTTTKRRTLAVIVAEFALMMMIVICRASDRFDGYRMVAIHWW
jgi:hypothetical protein